ncbi:MAG: methylenetetrahydrofolate reductase [NAD(P)H] [Clostridiaceae bacterium]
MKIKEIYKKRQTAISFEIFPPKIDSPIDTIYSTISELAELKPDFISVTYGAGGSTSKKTVEIASLIQNKYNINALAHLTCVTSTKEEITSILSQLKENNIENILALRGDLPQDFDLTNKNSLHYNYASDLISHIKSTNDFSIGAACYPEGHLECSDKKIDLMNLKKKVDLGVDFLVTQLFFNNKNYYDFAEKLYYLNIKTPVAAGIMPVINKNQINRICNLTGAEIPEKFKRIMDKYQDNPEALKEAGIAYATEQIIDLISSGIKGIHIYTMNKPEVAKSILININKIRSTI